MYLNYFYLKGFYLYLKIQKLDVSMFKQHIYIVRESILTIHLYLTTYQVHVDVEEDYIHRKIYKKCSF